MTPQPGEALPSRGALERVLFERSLPVVTEELVRSIFIEAFDAAPVAGEGLPLSAAMRVLDEVIAYLGHDIYGPHNHVPELAAVRAALAANQPVAEERT